MALALTQVITEDRASGGQVIDGSLKFVSGNSTHLTRTPSGAGNRKTWTWSGWVKLSKDSSATSRYFFAGNSAQTNAGFTGIGFNSDTIFIAGWATNWRVTSQVFRDFDSWYHIVLVWDTTQSTANDRVRLYVNGAQVTAFSTTNNPAQNDDGGVNTTSVHYISTYNASASPFDGYLSQAYFIDGLALDASYFGFTDPLTNTWRPKKYTGTYGTNGFYLPLDGNSPIGEDKSGNGNDFTPVGFGGSNSIEKATGALPILNTVSGGKVATVGQRSDSNSSSLVLALPLVGNANDIHHLIKGSGSAKTVTTNGNAAATSVESNFYGTSYVFDGTGDSLSLSSTSDFGFGTGDFTIECFVYYKGSFPTYEYIFDMRVNSSTGAELRPALYPSSDGGPVEYYINNTTAISGGKFYKDRWNHIAVVRNSSTTTLYLNGISVGSFSDSNNYADAPLVIGQRQGFTAQSWDGYIQDFRVYKGVAKYTSNFIPASTDPDILPDTPSGVAGGSALTKITDGAVYFDGNGDYLSIADNADFTLGTNDFTMEGYFYATAYNNYARPFGQSTEGGGSTNNAIGFFFDTGGNGDTLYLRYGTDPSGTATDATISNFNGGKNKWFHLALVRDGANLKIFKDGILLHTENIGASYSIYDSSANFNIGASSNPGEYWTGFISNVRVVNGTALYTSNFTPPTSALTNVTNTKLLCCHSNVSADAAIVSPGSITTNGNVTASNFNPFTTDIDAVRGQETGYCTLNPLDTDPARTSTVALSNGNLDASVSTYGTVQYVMRAATFPSNGKDYFEVTKGDNVNKRVYVGFLEAGGVRSGAGSGGIPYDFYGYGSGDTASANTAFVVRDGTAPTTGLPTLDPGTSGDVLMVAHDRENKKIWFGKNGIWFTVGGTVGNPATGTAPTLTYTTDAELLPCIGAGSFASTTIRKLNFGQKPFKYAPPEGFKTLCLANLPRPTEAAVRPDKYMGIVTYTGNNGTQTITGLGFDPGLVWIKNRTNDNNNMLFDVIRGTDNALISNTTAVEGASVDGTLSAFGSDGFTVYWDGQAGTGGNTNQSANNYVAWCWKAGGAAVSNTDGSITSSVSANQDAGFSIVSYTGTGVQGSTIGHGLGVAPKLIIAKIRSGTGSWPVYHSSQGAGKYGYLDTTGAFGSSNNFWGNGASAVEPTSSVFTIGSNARLNSNTQTHIAYCFAEVEAYSKFGSYTGNGNADGPFVHCGFKPAWVMVKATSFTNVYTGWQMWDAARNKYNVANLPLYANDDDKEGTNSQGTVELTSHLIDFVSNGFKIRTSNQICNSSGQTYIFAAFAEAPTNNLFGGQANAR